MKTLYEKYSIKIIPENPADEVYLESVLGLYAKNDEARAIRISVIGVDSAFAYVEIKKR